MPPRADYGVDAPYAPLMFGISALAAGVAAAISAAHGQARPTLFNAGYFLFFAGNLVSFLYTIRRGKHREWKRILDGLQLRGDEQVLDLGCGRGAVLTALARRAAQSTPTSGPQRSSSEPTPGTSTT